MLKDFPLRSQIRMGVFLAILSLLPFSLWLLGNPLVTRNCFIVCVALASLSVVLQKKEEAKSTLLFRAFLIAESFSLLVLGATQGGF